MSTRDALRTLIAKLEIAESGSRELDAEISCLVKFPHRRPARPDDFDGKFGFSPGNIKCEHGFLMADAYTTSLDAALALVPEGWQTMLNQRKDGWEAFLTRHHMYYAGGNLGGVPTPALALCIASLKARLAADCGGHSNSESERSDA